MRTLALFVAFTLLGSAAHAGGSCDLSEHKPFVFDQATAIPDGNVAGVTIGPIDTSGEPALTILDVVLDVDIVHTYAGDLRITLIYDQSCDGVGGADDVSADVLCNPGGVCAAAVNCPADVDGSYVFSGSAPSTFPEDQCLIATTLPPGCYLPELEVGGPVALDVFDGLPKGGCWYLFASDQFALDVGTVRRWSVHLMNDTGVPAEQTSWGGLKAGYR